MKCARKVHFARKDNMRGIVMIAVRSHGQLTFEVGKKTAMEMFREERGTSEIGVRSRA